MNVYTFAVTWRLAESVAAGVVETFIIDVDQVEVAVALAVALAEHPRRCDVAIHSGDIGGPDEEALARVRERLARTGFVLKRDHHEEAA